MAAMEHFDSDPVIHNGSYRLDRAARYAPNLKIDELPKSVIRRGWISHRL